MDIIALLPTLMLGMIFIIIVPFAILIAIFLRVIENESKGLLTMVGGFLMMCIGYFFMFLIAMSWGESNIISTAITTESLVLEANFITIILFSLPVVWIISSVFLMKDGYMKYKKSEEEEE